MRKILIITAALLIITFLTLGSSPQSPTAWEYKFVHECGEKKANTLGRDGWELVAIEASGPGITKNIATYVFKRRVSSPSLSQ